MNEVDYKAVICKLISEKLVTVERVKEIIKEISTEDVEKYNTPTWEASRRLIAYLNEKLRANIKKPCIVNITSLSSLEKLLRIDGRTEDEVREMIDWCQADEFWHTVILSTNKLRKHYDTMLSQRNRVGTRRPTLVNTAPVTPSEVDITAKIDEAEKEAVPMPEAFKKLSRRGAV